MFSTIEDIYMALFDTDRNQKEKIHLFDLAGVTADVCFMLWAINNDNKNIHNNNIKNKILFILYYFLNYYTF